MYTSIHLYNHVASAVVETVDLPSILFSTADPAFSKSNQLNNKLSLSSVQW